APLGRFAGPGVRSAASPGNDLVTLIPALTQAAGLAPRDANFLERLQAGAERLVRIRPLDAVPGDDPAAVLTRIEIRAREADVAGALAELAKLPAEAQAPAKAWIAKAQARIAALTASRRFAGDALAALPKAPRSPMIRVGSDLAIVGLLAPAAAWLADRPGDVLITWQNRRIETSVMMLAVGVLIVAALSAMLRTLVRAIVRAPDVLWLYLRT